MAKRLLIVLCGLPGAGKSTLARELERRLDALRWDKDELREILFPAARVRHGRALNDFCMELLYSGVRYAFGQAPPHVPVVILDGRPFMESAQRTRVREVAKQAGVSLAFVLCTAPMEVLRARVASGGHVAADRDPALLERLAARSESFEGDEIRVDTSENSVQEAALRCMKELAARGLVESSA